MHTDTYLPEVTYQNLIAALLALTPASLERECTDRLKLILGETAGIWPSTVRPDHGNVINLMGKSSNRLL